MTRLRPAFVALVVVMAACAGPATTPTPTAAPATTPPSIASPTAETTPEPTASPTPSSAPATVTIGAKVFSAGFNITVNSASYDPATARVTIDTTYENTGSRATSPLEPDAGLELKTTLAYGGEAITTFVQGDAIAPKATEPRTLTFDVPEGFSLDQAVLTYGDATQHQATVPLTAGATGTSEAPREFPISGSTKVGDLLTVTLTEAWLTPAGCWGTFDSFGFAPASKDFWGLVLIANATLTGSLDEGLSPTSVTVPDGTTSGDELTVFYVDGGDTLRDGAMCFMVPSPGTGDYTLTMTGDRANVDGTIDFTVPEP